MSINLAIQTKWRETALEFAYAGWINGGMSGYTFSSMPAMWGDSPYSWLHSGIITGYGYTWGDTLILVEEAKRHADGGIAEDLNIWANKDLKKKKRLIELICRINGQFYKESKNVADAKLNIKDIEMLYNEIKKANLVIESVQLLEK